MFFVRFFAFFFFFFFFNDPATTEIYTLSLHDALPIFEEAAQLCTRASSLPALRSEHPRLEDRKSTRLNSSHVAISYAVFCLKKKKFKVGLIGTMAHDDVVDVFFF